MFEPRPNKKNQKLFDAMLAEDFDAMRRFLATGLSINTQLPGGGKQILHAACEVGKEPSVIEKLLELGADVNGKTERGFTPLHVAAQRGNGEVILTLLKAGAEIDAVTLDGMGTTPFQEAAANGRVKAVKTLMFAGADIDYREKKLQMNALELAAHKGVPPEMMVLLSMGWQHVFKQRVQDTITQWEQSHLSPSMEELTYVAGLKAIPHESLSSDNYFRQLTPALNCNYEPVKASMKPLRSAIIQSMKLYNEDKTLELHVKEALSVVKDFSPDN